jgi:hypothetical protein
MLAQTRPLESAMASMVIQTMRVLLDSHQTVDAVIDENSLVNVTLIKPPHCRVTALLVLRSCNSWLVLRCPSSCWPYLLVLYATPCAFGLVLFAGFTLPIWVTTVVGCRVLVPFPQ